MQLRSSDISIFDGFERPALVIAVVARMLLGLGLAITLFLWVYMMILTDLRCDPAATSLGNTIRCSNPVDMIAASIFILAGIGVAAAFFAARRIDFSETLSMLLVAVLIRFVGDVTVDSATWQLSLVIFSLFAAFASVAVIRWLRMTAKDAGEIEPPKPS